MLNSGTYIAPGIKRVTKTIWMFPKIGGKPTKMDGENIMEQTIKMDDLGGFPIFLERPILVTRFTSSFPVSEGPTYSNPSPNRRTCT